MGSDGRSAFATDRSTRQYSRSRKVGGGATRFSVTFTGSEGKGMTTANHCQSTAVEVLVQRTALAMPLCLLPTANAFDGVSQQLTAVVQQVPIELFIHRPTSENLRGVLLVLHGQRRNAAEYRDLSRSLANEHGLLLVAPSFDRDRFPSRRYQRGGITRRGRLEPRERWTVNLIPALLEWIREHEGKTVLPAYVYGHSAGGQFLSRVAAFADPVDIRQIVIANPSSHVIADLDEAAPYGLGGVFDAAAGEAALRRYLGLPITIYLGGRDTGNQHLHGHAAAKRQGDNRLERGRYAFGRAAAAARRLDAPFNWSLVVAPEAGHSAAEMLDSPQAAAAFGLPR